jgi:peptidoglycan/LPS O-acetylase OafA/YrhL
MRAVAILAVVLYHAHVNVLRGGFTGVDDFFVISGFLITGLLWRELESRHNVSFRAFYGRRIQRLLPASFLVLAVTAIASAHWLPPLQARATLKDGVASALYVGNYRFAFLQTNYLTATAPPSPFQHYWSLGVEEQFYLVWPLLLLVASVAWRGRAPSRRNGAAALAVLAVLSFGFSVWLTRVDQPWAFFSLPTRAWELAVGGLVAFAVPWLRLLAPRPAAVLGWVGLATVVGTVLALPSSVPYPGTAALLPVLGTAAVLASGCARAPAGPILVLRRSAMQVIGRVSYSWYLWHWPVLILAPYVVGHALSLAANLGLVAGSFLLAVVTFVVVENPVRTMRWLRALPRRELRLGATLTACGLVVCGLSILTLPSLTGHGIAPVAAISSGGRPAAEAGSAGGTRTASGSTVPVDLYQVQLTHEDAEVEQDVARSVKVPDVPANLTPSLANAEGDEPPVFVDGCMDQFLADNVLPCDFADVNSPTTVVLFGDSHAAMWWPAVDGAANALGWHLLNLTKATCPPLEIDVFSPELGRDFTECTLWREAVLQRIAEVHPALVILGVARHYSTAYGFTVYGPEWLSGLSQMVTTIRQMGSQVMVMGPIPKPPSDVPGCLSDHLTTATACTVPFNAGVNAAGQAAEQATVTAAGGIYVPTEPWFCTATTCAVIVDNLLVYRDDNHITATYSRFLTPVLEDELGLAVPGSAPAVPPTTTTTTTVPTPTTAPPGSG